MGADAYYKHSGGVGLLGPVFMLILGLAGALVGGAVYGFAIFYIPFVYLNFLFTLGLGFLTGWLVGAGARLGKVRNNTVTTLGGLLMGLVAWHAGWVCWILAASGRTVLAVLPGDVWSVAGDVAKTGVWSVFGWTPAGVWLYVIWLAEFGLIVLTACDVAWGHLSDRPFCERCVVWTGSSEPFPDLEPLAEPEALKARLRAGGLGRARPASARGAGRFAVHAPFGGELSVVRQ